jgi:hypothetical protein
MLRSTYLNAAADAPTRSTLRESESGALVEELSELAIVYVFSLLSSEFCETPNSSSNARNAKARLIRGGLLLVTLPGRAGKVTSTGSATRND